MKQIEVNILLFAIIHYLLHFFFAFLLLTSKQSEYHKWAGDPSALVTNTIFQESYHIVDFGLLRHMTFALNAHEGDVV